MRQGVPRVPILTLLGLGLALLVAAPLMLVAQPKPSEAPPSTPVTLTDAQAEALLYALLTPGGDPGWNASAAAVLEAQDPRFAAPVIDMLRFRELPHAGLLLTALTGQDIGTDWAAWTEWLGRNPVPPLPGYPAWKGTLLALATDEPEFRRFLHPGVKHRVRLDEIAWGGVAVDGIPALERPKLAEDTSFLQFDELVAGVFLGGEARAYPLRIIDWHEMVNDVVGGRPISLAYCTLCGSAVLYATRVGDTTYTFGSSGLLMRSNKLMFDRQTDTLWNQLTGEPVVGGLSDSGLVLERLPVVISTWSEWRTLHPDTGVVGTDTGHQRDYRPGQPYGEYFGSPSTMFPVWRRKNVLPDKERVFAMLVGGAPKVWPLTAFDTNRVIEDSLGGTDLVLVGGPEGVETSEPGGRSIRAYERGDRRFSAWDDPWRLRANDGGVWTVTEDALVGPQGERLPRLAGHVAYWFGWFAYFPKTAVHGEVAPAGP